MSKAGDPIGAGDDDVASGTGQRRRGGPRRPTHFAPAVDAKPGERTIVRDPIKGRPTDPIDPSEDAEAVKTVVGPNIARIRSGRKMAVRQLAEHVGVSAAFISQIEHSAALPSVATLVRIAKSLRVNIGDLFDAAPAPRMVIRRRERSVYEYPDRGIAESQISSDPSGSLEVLWIKLTPGAGTGTELFAHGADTEFVFVLKGEVSITVGAEAHVLVGGDSLTFPGSEVHGSENVGKGDAEFLWVQTPATY